MALQAARRRRRFDPVFLREALGLQGALGHVMVAVALLILVINGVDVVTMVQAHDSAPVTTLAFSELTAGLAAILLLPIVMRGVLVIARARLWLALRLLALCGWGLAFALVHIPLFRLARGLAHALVGAAYVPGRPGPLIYEIAKDFWAYALIVAGMFAAPPLRRILLGEAPDPAPAATATDDAPLFDITDGRRTVRAAVSDIRAAASAGNYVEFHLADGRKPLMRATLASVEQRLASRGLVRVHRSWIVNPAQVTAIEALASGDFRLTLSGGEIAPGSRRYGAAIRANICSALA
jgi:hypothetical protein